MTRRPIIGWEEQDVHTKWGRKYLFWHTGELRLAKRRSARRERRAGSAEIAEQLEEAVGTDHTESNHIPFALDVDAAESSPNAVAIVESSEAPGEDVAIAEVTEPGNSPVVGGMEDSGETRG